MGYTWREPADTGGIDVLGILEITGNQTEDIIDEALDSALSDKIIMPPAVFAGIIGFAVIMLAVTFGQISWAGIKKVRSKKSSELLRTAGYM
jgi:hypothetical protein